MCVHIQRTNIYIRHKQIKHIKYIKQQEISDVVNQQFYNIHQIIQFIKCLVKCLRFEYGVRISSCAENTELSDETETQGY